MVGISQNMFYRIYLDIGRHHLDIGRHHLDGLQKLRGEFDGHLSTRARVTASNSVFCELSASTETCITNRSMSRDSAIFFKKYYFIYMFRVIGQSIAKLGYK